jgi:hypothetical protein
LTGPQLSGRLVERSADAQWVTPPHRKMLFGRFESDGPAEYRFVPAGPPDRAALIALLDAHSDYTDPPDAQASALALRDTLRS